MSPVDLSFLPSKLQAITHQALSRLNPDAATQQPEGLAGLLATSDYAAEVLATDAKMLSQLAKADRLTPPLKLADYKLWCQQALSNEEGQPPTDEASLLTKLRLFRRAVMLRLLWRDSQFAGQPQQVWQTAAEITALAEVTTEAALAWLEDFYAPLWGKPYPRGTSPAKVEAGEVKPLRLVVLGMGKLGAGELNLSSDIDLIFAFESQGETLGGKRSFENQEYFTRLGQKLIALLDKPTAEGFVFRVDMRLRPYGDAGALALSFNALLEYYQQQGRDWERYAMIKARVIAGDKQAGESLLNELRPFVYRKYLDFSAIEALRAMKAMINREVRRKSLENNIKLGLGGIREVEFISQVFQLIRGGRDTELQERSIRKVLPIISSLGLMPEEASKELLAAYEFLRDLEHALQGLADKQTQTLPEDEIAQARLAWRCGFTDWPDLYQHLQLIKQQVRQHFNAIIADPEEEQPEPTKIDEALACLWNEQAEPALAEEAFQQAGFKKADASLKVLQSLYSSRAVANMQPIGRERLNQLMPQLLMAVAATQNPDAALERTLWLVEAVLRRTAYLVLLTENPEALKQLVTICAASPWLAEQLAKMPILLDELLSPETLYTPADKNRLQDELRQHLTRIPEEDIEALMEALRYFRHANVLRVAASDLIAQRHLMKVSDYLTYIAEVLLEKVLNQTLRDLTRRYGRPRLSNGEPADSGFIIVGYGKLGGIELGYGSDLDLVFIHDGHPTLASDGEKNLDSVTWFSRLGQRIIHFLATATPSGQLYEVDMRLRPSGNAGLLVSSLKAFADYQANQAWTWEHQALVRARVVAGDAQLTQQFNALRGTILGQKRDLAKLKEDVVSMREKMRANLGSKQGEVDLFHVKQDAGGLVDIEFMVQYLVLAYSHAHPQLYEFTDNMRILDALAATGVLPQAKVDSLQEAYLIYRKTTHHAALEKAGTFLPAQPWVEYRQQVTQVWQELLLNG